ncbi:hypothetical protein [Aquimarina muelleri]|uniref:Lipoprotein n=1 Tax=Aquimarina muelleri TaxID=279356 RepID=A0A918JUB9_9FLAO|nr:hypothetical protein [Aquimarina muelleri]MCX2763895.1 hypothetical protein [Aquimarina muelleri]GGX10973.1 hypothetical protein GCM10007384_10880 [Aquimarina muelleri]
MKKTLALLFIIILLASCNSKVNKEPEAKKEPKEEIIPDRSADFPEDITAVFKAHGGILAFDQMNTLVFEKVNPEGNEKHITDLKTRRARIETDKFVLGFDGKEAWIVQDSTYFERDPRFYHNLMFYFYTMPFVLGDQGISYQKSDDLKVDGISYPGYKISYGDGVGDSPKDNYFLYYDKASKKMKFLGYTVTFFSKETSEKISLVEYTDWNDVNGLLLPKTLKWREYKDGLVGNVKKEVNFINAKASKQKPSASLFEKPKEEKAENL